MKAHMKQIQAAVFGAGPAGLMAAERLAQGGARVTLYDRMPSAGRKFLMAGRGGLNLTNAEAKDKFRTRFGYLPPALAGALDALSPQALVEWCEALGQPTFTGSSGRVFPKGLKSSPLLRAWLWRLAGMNVALETRHEWLGFAPGGGMAVRGPAGVTATLTPDVSILALGGASWPKLGADGSWVAPLRAAGAPVADLAPANCGFDVAWSDVLKQRFAGQPVKNVALSFGDASAGGEIMLAAYGIEGGAVYALARPLREAIAAQGEAVLAIDLKPGVSAGELARRLGARRKGETLTNLLRRAAGLSPPAIALLREDWAGRDESAAALAARIKHVTLRLTAPRPLARAISTAGGVQFSGLDAHFMLKARPGTFLAGEMLDWEAPTGGYLLQACFATGAAAAAEALAWAKAQV